jgi:lipopolysaccharide transport system permease protein
MSVVEKPFRNHVIKPRSSFAVNWQELWQYRELLYFFAWKEVKVRYKQAVLGVAWTLLQPLAMMVVFIVLLHRGLGVSTGEIPPPIYYLSGLVIWNLFNHAVTNAAGSMVSNAHIIKKIYFPRLVIPISSVLVSSFDFLISLILFFILILYYQITGGIVLSWLMLIAALLVAYIITATTAFSLGTFLAAVNVKYRDVRYALPFFVQSLFFITPVMYDGRVIQSEWIVNALQWNPLYWAIEMVRQALLGNLIWARSSDIWWIGLVLMLMFMIAIYVFRKTEAYFADIV